MRFLKVPYQRNHIYSKTLFYNHYETCGLLLRTPSPKGSNCSAKLQGANKKEALINRRGLGVYSDIVILQNSKTLNLVFVLTFKSLAHEP